MSCSKQSFSIGKKEENFNEFDKDNMVEIRGLYMNKKTGKVYFVLDDAYVEIISFYEWLAKENNELKKEAKRQ